MLVPHVRHCSLECQPLLEREGGLLCRGRYRHRSYVQALTQQMHTDPAAQEDISFNVALAITLTHVK